MVEKFHFTNESDEMLMNAKKKGYDDETTSVVFYIWGYKFDGEVPHHLYKYHFYHQKLL